MCLLKIAQVCHYIWLLSYCPKVQNKLADMEVVALLVHVMKSTQKEKVIRMILAILVNLIDLPEMQNILAVCGAQRLLQSMYNRSWSDEDIKDDIDELLDKVGKNVEASSTFDEYCKEVMSGELEWTPMHRSATFWEKNVHKFLEKDQQVLKVLVELLKPGARIDSKALAVALHDVGEFVRAHPAGKKHVTALNAKPYIMQHLTSSNTEINKEALTCVQKLMVH
jgi:V-type H+-transporting ATPase subunit H